MNSGIPLIKIADRVEVTVDLRVGRVDGPPLVFKAIAKSHSARKYGRAADSDAGQRPRQKDRKKILAKTTAIWHVDRLRLSETSKDNGTYWTFELGLLEGVVVFRTLRVAKSFRKWIIDYSKGRRSRA